MCQGVDFSGAFSGQNLLLASGAMKAVGNIVQGNQAADYLEYQSAQALADARAEREIGGVRANRVRKAGTMVRNEAIAAQGASGSSVNSKSAEEVVSYIDKSSENDALTELYSGIARGRSLEGTAAGYRAQAGLTRTGAYMSGFGSLLGGAAQARAAADASDKWIRRRLDMRPTTFGDTYSLDDPAYG